jgi:acyl carrier protein
MRLSGGAQWPTIAMGLDFLDLTFRIERVFDVKMSEEDFSGLMRNRDIAVGDIYEFLLKKLNLRDVGRYDLRLNEYLWSQMRSALHSASETPFEQIQLGIALEEIFPRDMRRARWKALREICPYRVRELDYSRFIRLAGFLLATTVVLLEQFQVWQIPGAQLLWPLLGGVGIWMVCETYLKVLAICAPLRNCFPAKMTTVKDLCRSVLASNYADICDLAELALDGRCSAVWEQLVDVLVETLGVDPADVTFRSRLFGDLGAQ